MEIFMINLPSIPVILDIAVFYQTLEIMWKGVVGVFAVLIIIAIVVWLLSLTDKRSAQKDKKQNK